MSCGGSRIRSLGMIASAALVLAAPAAMTAKSVCIPAYQIDHTEVTKDNAILFYMINRKAWRAPLVNHCSTLYPSTRGFTYEPTVPGSDSLCSNLVTIHVNDTHETCLLGAFEPYTPPQKAAQAR